MARLLRSRLAASRTRALAQASRTEGPADVHGSLTGSVAKWFLPSASVLFVVTGYVILAAHHSFLGIEFDNVGAAEYTEAAAAFWSDIFVTVVDVAVDSQGPTTSDLPPWGLLVGLIIATGAVLVFGKRAETRTGARWLLTCALAVIVLLTFARVHAPLTQLNAVLVGSGQGAGEVSHSAPIEERLSRTTQLSAFSRYEKNEAAKIWGRLVCSRVSKSEIAAIGITTPAECSPEKEQNEKVIRQLFGVYSAISVTLLILSAQCLRIANSPFHAMIALVACAYAFTWPYSYGKLLWPTTYPFGLIEFKDEGQAGTKQNAASSKQFGIILARNSTSSKILITTTSQCPTNQVARHVKLWDVSNSQILAIKEIYREDVVAWKRLHEIPCQAGRGPL